MPVVVVWVALCACILSHISHVLLFATLWTTVFQAPLSMGFSPQKYWSGLPWPSPGDLPDPGIKSASLMSPALAGRFFTTRVTWEAPWAALCPVINQRHRPIGAPPSCGMMRKSRELYKAFCHLNLEMMKINILLARGSHKAHLTARGPQHAGEPKNLFMNLTISAILTLIKSFFHSWDQRPLCSRYVAAGMGREFEGEWIHLSAWSGPLRWLSSKESACQCRWGAQSLVRKIPCRRKWPSTLIFLHGKPHGQRSLADYSP